MSDFILFNGKFLPAATALVGADNRGLRFGDGLFETFRFTQGKIAFEEWHFERLFKGLNKLGFECPALYTPAALAGLTATLCRKNGHSSARVRINIFRGNGGLYDPENHHPHTIIQTWPLPGNGFELNENGLVAGVYTEANKPMDAFANLKTNNFLAYTMAALHAKKQHWNEAFVLNTAGRICDATIANIFIVKDGQITTPPLTEGCIAGIMRRHFLEQLPLHGYRVQEKALPLEDLLAADELFLTNAVRGIRWVRECGPSSYTNLQTLQIFNKLLKKNS
jgi:branched-chain amino acid aminotransferase